MKEIEKYIERVYENIGGLIGVNLNWYDNKKDKVIKYNAYYIPKPIEYIEEEKIIRVGKMIGRGNKKSVCYFENAYKLRYIAVGKFSEEEYEGAVILGPYLSYEHSTHLIQAILGDKEIGVEEREKLHLFYSILPIIDFNKENRLTNILKALLYCEDIENEPFEVEEKEEVPEVNLHYLVEDITLKEEVIKKGYEVEEELVHYISTGNTKEAMNMIKGRDILILNRFPTEPLRDFKNLLIIANTIYRRTLCANKIQAYLIHIISEKYAIAIEKSTTKNQLQKLSEEMLETYCEVVNKYKNNGYSEVINRTIKYIDLYFNQAISLNDIASKLYVHPNYLSQKFRHETQVTISEYINQVRIREAKYLLQYKSELSLTDIAYTVGYNDKNYFSKVFKHSEGITPKQYRQK